MAGVGELLTSGPPQHDGADGPVRRFAVVGSPVGHSLSPVMHRAAYAELGITDAVYDRYDVPARQLADFLCSDVGEGLQGLSVTMPGKPEAFALAARRDATAELLGVANTLLRHGDGSWRAENHDVHGIVAALRDHGATGGGTGAVLGSGATALCAVAALAQLGVQEVLLSARSPEKLTPLEQLAEGAGITVEMVPFDRSEALLGADILISALAAPGARAVAERWGGLAARDVPGVLLDVLYDPWPAPIAGLLSADGAEVADGLEMLAHQAGQQVRSMLAVPEAPVAAMLAAARNEIGAYPAPGQ